jgi:hypothetical protein
MGGRNPHKPPVTTWEPPERLRKTFWNTAFALSELRRGENSYDLSSGLALIWRNRLGTKERAFMLATAVKAASPADAVFLHKCLSDVLAPDLTEGQRQADDWAQYHANKEKRRA